jgi:hypothetical protein
METIEGRQNVITFTVRHSLYGGLYLSSFARFADGTGVHLPDFERRFQRTGGTMR